MRSLCGRRVTCDSFGSCPNQLWFNFFGQNISDVSGSHVMLLVTMFFFIWMEKAWLCLCVFIERLQAVETDKPPVTINHKKRFKREGQHCNTTHPQEKGPYATRPNAGIHRTSSGVLLPALKIIIW